MDVSSFSDFFDAACGLTNLLILAEPLNHGDFIFHNNILLMWVNEIEKNEANWKLKETARRERRRLERDEFNLVNPWSPKPKLKCPLSPIFCVYFHFLRRFAFNIFKK